VSEQSDVEWRKLGFKREIDEEGRFALKMDGKDLFFVLIGPGPGPA